MNNISTVRTLRAIRHAVFFSFVTAPALSLFIGFVFLSFNNSLAGGFMDEARSLVADAPPGKVWGCAPPRNTSPEDSFPPVPSVKPVCEPVLVDAAIWQQSVDSVIRHFYLWMVILGALVWLFCNGFFRGLTETVVAACRLMKEKAGKMISTRRGER